MNKLTNVLRYVLAIVLGYAAMALLLFVVQDYTLGRPELGVTPFYLLLLVGVGSTLAAVAGGWLAGVIKKSKKLWPQVLMCLLIITESTYLMAEGITDNPIWFEMIASASLLLGILVGGWVANYGWIMPKKYWAA